MEMAVTCYIKSETTSQKNSNYCPKLEGTVHPSFSVETLEIACNKC